MAVFDQDDASTAENGLIVTTSGPSRSNRSGYFSGQGDPTLSGGTPAPLGSMYIRHDSAQVWQKVGALDTEWNQIDPGSFYAANHYQFAFNYAGNLNNAWMDHGSSQINSDASPHVIPHDLEILGMTFSNQSDDVSTDLQLWKADYNAGSTSTLVMTMEVRNARTRVATDFTPVQCSAGDKIGVFGSNVAGSNPNKVVVYVVGQLTSGAEALNLIEDWTGSL